MKPGTSTTAMSDRGARRMMLYGAGFSYIGQFPAQSKSGNAMWHSPADMDLRPVGRRFIGWLQQPPYAGR